MTVRDPKRKQRLARKGADWQPRNGLLAVDENGELAAQVGGHE